MTSSGAVSSFEEKILKLLTPEFEGYFIKLENEFENVKKIRLYNIIAQIILLLFIITNLLIFQNKLLIILTIFQTIVIIQTQMIMQQIINNIDIGMSFYRWILIGHKLYKLVDNLNSE